MPTRELSAGETKGSFVSKLNNKRNICKQISSLFGTELLLFTAFELFTVPRGKLIFFKKYLSQRWSHICSRLSSVKSPRRMVTCIN